MTKNFIFGIVFIAVILLLGLLFTSQQNNQKNPLETSQPVGSTAPAATAAPLLIPPSLRQLQSPCKTVLKVVLW